jgi:hypothetical protein
VDGSPLAEANVQVVWRPDYPGFYRIVAVDSRSRSRSRQATARVRVRQAPEEAVAVF